jgi:translocation and assembly module TamB
MTWRDARRRLWKAARALLILTLVLLGASWLVVRSEWFRDRVQERLVYEIERATGGKATLRSFTVTWPGSASVQGLVVRGKEPNDAEPLLSLDAAELAFSVRSLWHRDVQLRSLKVTRPRVWVRVDASGNTNLPGPQRQATGSPLDPVFDVGIGRYEVVDGWFRLADEMRHYSGTGENIRAKLHWDAEAKGYAATVGLRLADLQRKQLKKPVRADIEAETLLLRNRIEVGRMTVAWPGVTVRAKGEVSDLRDPQVTLDCEGRVAAREVQALLGQRWGLSGDIDAEGRITMSRQAGFVLAGSARMPQARLDWQGRTLAGSVRGRFRLEPALLEFQDLMVDALGGRATGQARLVDWNRYSAQGQIRELSLERAWTWWGSENPGLNAAISGPFELTGTFGRPPGWTARAALDLAPLGSDLPIEGRIEAAIDSRTGQVVFQDSALTIAGAPLQLAGSLADGIPFRVRLDQPRALERLWRLSGATDAAPAKLDRNGWIELQGTIRGTLQDPALRGHVRFENIRIQDQPHIQDQLLSRGEADAEADRTRVTLSAIDLQTPEGVLRGEGTASLQDGKLTGTSTLEARVTFSSPSLRGLLRRANAEAAADGRVEGEGTIRGTVDQPEAAGVVRITGLEAMGEHLAALTARIQYGRQTLTANLEPTSWSGGTVRASATYRHAKDDWNQGAASFELDASAIALERIARVQEKDPQLRGVAAASLRGQWDSSGNGILRALDGSLSIRRLRHDARRGGNFDLSLSSSGSILRAQLRGDVRETPVTGNAEVRLTEGYPVQGDLQLARIDAATIEDILLGLGYDSELPVDGFTTASATFRGRLDRPESLLASVLLPTVEVRPRAEQMDTKVAEAFQLRSDGPVRLDVSRDLITVRALKVSGSGTQIEASGSIALGRRQQANLQLRGTLNLAQIRTFYPDLVATGQSRLDILIRGTPTQPDVQGKLEFEKASFALPDVAQGLTNAQGLIVFDRNRANIDTLRAETGGGTIEVSGFVGFGDQRLIYRLQGAANQIRVRRDGISLTSNAILNLAGTTDASFLSGTVTVLRAGLTENDIGALIASTRKPVTPVERAAVLRNMKVDIQVQSAPNLVFTTSLTNDVQADVNVRIKGTAANPSLLGAARLNAGEINLFGTKYSIQRGQLSFYNPARIDPVVDLDLLTVARGISVNINLSGNLSRLNFSYRSDPPLQSDQLFALLLVGRDPNTNPAVAANSPAAGANGVFQSGGNTLLGQAITAPLSTRLNRLFGVTRLKIDPQLTGLNNTPQAVLTLEQQISRDVTLTYVTNLARTNQQLVRVQWDFNRNWSGIATRDENGLFAVDLQYRTGIR